MTKRCSARTWAVAALGTALAPVASYAALSDASRVGPGGVGPIVFGTTPAQAAATGTLFTQSQPVRGSTCYYLRPKVPVGLSFIVEGGNIRRADVATPSIATVDGFKVGDSATKLATFYGARARTLPDKYDPELKTIQIAPKDGAPDAPQRLVYKVKHGAVVSIIAGLRPQVDYVEGCS